MIALIASALLGLYVLLPVFVFDKLAGQWARLKRYQRTKVEEFVAGIIVAGLPFLVAQFFSHWSWYVGHWPFPVSEVGLLLKRADYKIVFNAFYSQSYFDTHVTDFWLSFWRVVHHQARFLFWQYVFLFAEIAVVVLITWQFGRLNQFAAFRKTVGRVLLRRVSEWQALLTTFVFHPSENRSVEVDLMTTDGKLYRGTVLDHFTDKDGALSGLLLKDAHRFQYPQLQADREAKTEKPTATYWREIPGANLYVAFDKILTLNLRYELPDEDLTERLSSKVEQITGVPSSIVVDRSGTATTKQSPQMTAGVGQVKVSTTNSEAETDVSD